MYTTLSAPTCGAATTEPAPPREVVSEETPAPAAAAPCAAPDRRSVTWLAVSRPCAAVKQGLTLVHFSAQLERFYGIGGARRGCVARVKGLLGGV